MAADRMDLYVGNSAAGVNNPAICTFHFLSPSAGSQAECLAQCIAFMQFCSPAAATFIHSARWTAAGAAGSTPMNFPVAEYATLQAADPTNLVALTAFGDTFGAGDMSAIGVGITVSLYTAVPGRKTTGRVYTPWLSEGAVTSGYVTPGARNGAQVGYLGYVFGNGLLNPAVTALGPVVHSATAGDTVVSAVTASLIPSRLKTRTR